jgi:hypothetical protein
MRSLFLMIFVVIAFASIVRIALLQKDDHDAEPFTYSFHVDGILEESSDPASSSSEYWWLDSGGRLIIKNGVGTTIQGALPRDDRWRSRYAESSPEDTSDGRYPQNLFRLVTQHEWKNVAVSARFKVTRNNESSSENQNESNGLLLMSRYQDGDNLYYAGIRVDGHAVIKKKTNGSYTTLAEQAIYSGTYNGTNLIPRDEWIELKSETITRNGTVEIIFSMKDATGMWQPVLSAIDTESAILNQGHAGIRTDFMDVEFDDFRAEPI